MTEADHQQDIAGAWNLRGGGQRAAPQTVATPTPAVKRLEARSAQLAYSDESLPIA